MSALISLGSQFTPVRGLQHDLWDRLGIADIPGFKCGFFPHLGWVTNPSPDLAKITDRAPASTKALITPSGANPPRLTKPGLYLGQSQPALMMDSSAIRYMRSTDAGFQTASTSATYEYWGTFFLLSGTQDLLGDSRQNPGATGSETSRGRIVGGTSLRMMINGAAEAWTPGIDYTRTRCVFGFGRVSGTKASIWALSSKDGIWRNNVGASNRIGHVDGNWGFTIGSAQPAGGYANAQAANWVGNAFLCFTPGLSADDRTKVQRTLAAIAGIVSV